VDAHASGESAWWRPWPA